MHLSCFIQLSPDISNGDESQAPDHLKLSSVVLFCSFTIMHWSFFRIADTSFYLFYLPLPDFLPFHPQWHRSSVTGPDVAAASHSWSSRCSPSRRQLAMSSPQSSQRLRRESTSSPRPLPVRVCAVPTCRQIRDGEEWVCMFRPISWSASRWTLPVRLAPTSSWLSSGEYLPSGRLRLSWSAPSDHRDWAIGTGCLRPISRHVMVASALVLVLFLFYFIENS